MKLSPLRVVGTDARFSILKLSVNIFIGATGARGGCSVNGNREDIRALGDLIYRGQCWAIDHYSPPEGERGEVLGHYQLDLKTSDITFHPVPKDGQMK